MNGRRTSSSAGPVEYEHVELKRVALVVNPSSGSGGSADIASKIMERWAARGVHSTLVVGGSARHARQLVAETVQAGDVDAVVVCGGDGMVSLVLQELVDTDMPMGVVPTGSGNDFARDLGIPRFNWRAAADLIVAGHVQHCDVGVATTAAGEKHYFASVLCAGFDSAANRRVNEMRLIGGSVRYLIATIVLLPIYQAKRYRMVFDDTDVVTAKVTNVAFGNTRYYGGGMQICPTADRADGILDATWIAGASNSRILPQVPFIYFGQHVKSKSVYTRRFRKVTLEADGGDVEAFADGDPVAPLPITVEVLPKAIRYFVPSPKGGEVTFKN